MILPPLVFPGAGHKVLVKVDDNSVLIVDNLQGIIHAEFHYAECRYDECRYAECRGACLRQKQEQGHIRM